MNGLYFIDGMLKAEKILDKNVIRFIMKEVLNIVCMDCMWYQHDGCPALYARISRETSNNSFFYYRFAFIILQRNNV